MRNFSFLLRLAGISLGIGVAWLVYARLYAFPIPFSVQGLLLGVWFLPALIAVALQKKKGLRIPGAVAGAEILAAAVSAAFGPLGVLSLLFGSVQGIAAEFVFLLRRSFWEIGAALLLADLGTLAWITRTTNPHSVSAWILHILGAAVSTFGVTAFARRIAR